MPEFDKDKPTFVLPSNLKGPDGNAFVLIGMVSATMRKHGYKQEFIEVFQDEAMSGDYQHVLDTIATFCNLVQQVREFIPVDKVEI